MADGETMKAHARRVHEGWYDRYIQFDRPGLDIGCGKDPLCPAFRRWDQMFGDGDCTYLTGIPDETFFTVYASHVLEHLDHPITALREWWRVLHPGGNMIILVPEVSLYEGQDFLPSRWNPDHRSYWVKDYVKDGKPPHHRGLRQVIEQALGSGDNIISLLELSEDHYYPDKLVHPKGEYSVEAVIHKP